MRVDRRQLLGTFAVAAAGAWLAPRPTGAEAPPAGAAAFALPPLPWPADALEPHLDAETMTIHHGKHHAAYVARLNEAVASAPALAGWPVERLLAELDRVPEAVRTAVRNHGGGHHNHTLFWSSLKPGGAAPGTALRHALEAEFGSLDAVLEKLTAAALGVFGSGWAWLVAGADGRLAVTATANQDSPLSAGATPLLGVDVWEHAYYLRYQNRRADYLKAWARVIDWTAVEARIPPRRP
jgi:Fe-Mn family superoxide dismutase